MKPTNHTPTPWSVGYVGPTVLVENESGNSNVCYMAANNNGDEESQANAAFIVKAVNCHADLVEALQIFLLWNQEKDQYFKSFVGCTLSEKIVIEKICAALAKAGAK